MTQEIKDRWLTALRSGEYKQGRYALHNNDGDKYCCLGVLADVIDPSKWNIVKRTWDGWETSIPCSFLPRDIQNGLIAMNDFYAKTFSEIADWVEIRIPTEAA